MGIRSGQQESDRVFEIQNYIQSNYQSQITLNDLASKLFFSNAYLSKYIKKQLGLSFMKYLSNVRLFHAMEDLLYTDKKIANIAIDNGFPTTSSFNKTFRETYHMTPSFYRVKKRPEDDSEVTNRSGGETSGQMQQRSRSYLKERRGEVQTAADSKLMTVDVRTYTELKRLRIFDV